MNLAIETYLFILTKTGQLWLSLYTFAQTDNNYI